MDRVRGEGSCPPTIKVGVSMGPQLIAEKKMALPVPELQRNVQRSPLKISLDRTGVFINLLQVKALKLPLPLRGGQMNQVDKLVVFISFCTFLAIVHSPNL